MTKFQLILTGVFAAFIILGVIIFSAYRGSSQNATDVIVWGTIPQNDFSKIIQETSLHQSKEYNVKYVEKTKEEFDSDFIESLASGNGPDLFMLPSDKIIKHRNKVYPIPYNVLTKRQFKDSFIEGAEIYMAPEGVLALPIYADPLVMYWNRSIFTEAKITEPPKYWDEFYNLANLISKKDGTLNILKSLVAFGGFNNVAHAKEIIVNLAMQAGTPITEWGNNGVSIVFSNSFNKPIIPAEAAVNFYNEFGNPSKPSYSWNVSLPNSTEYFLRGDLALYFGMGSEAVNLQLKNPNLNFDLAPVPISREGGNNTSFADFNAFAIAKSSKSLNAAYAVASILSGPNGAVAMNKILKLPPVRRDLLAQRQTDTYQSVFYESIIRSKTWLDPEPAESKSIFKSMIESIISGRARTGEAVVKAGRELGELLK
jgi:ABC-type glycerol-3-phosphate transport system substrate-binding protein